MKQVLNPVVLTSEQNQVLRTVKDGKNIFFTGSAGTGKSFLLKKIIGGNTIMIGNGKTISFVIIKLDH